MSEDTIVCFPNPAIPDELTDLLRDGARKMLMKAIEAEVTSFTDEHDDVLLEDGRKPIRRLDNRPRPQVQSVGQNSIGPWPRPLVFASGPRPPNGVEAMVATMIACCCDVPMLKRRSRLLIPRTAPIRPLSYLSTIVVG